MVYSVVLKYFKNDRLWFVFFFYLLLIGGNLFVMILFYCFIVYLESKYGVYYVMGGINVFVKGIVGFVIWYGGIICYGEIIEII